jgi:hypothetical protein
MASLPRAHARSARASRLDLPGTVSHINDYFDPQGWTDGLPIIPPTEDLVSSMLEASPAPAEQVLGQLPPRNGTVTVEKVAINAVMAGCQPAYFPVVLAAVKAVLQPQFNAGAITTTTGGAAPVVIVSGPIARRLGIHSGTAVLGSGHRANATIGRGLRLTMRNLGGATADTMEKSTHGWPGKYTMCFAENAERNPWEPLHSMWPEGRAGKCVALGQLTRGRGGRSCPSRVSMVLTPVRHAADGLHAPSHGTAR